MKYAVLELINLHPLSIWKNKSYFEVKHS